MAHLYAEIERCRGWIQAALDHGGNTHSVEDIRDGILEQRYQFWAAEDACCVTEIIDYPRKRVFHGFLAGGNLDRILDMFDSMERFAQIVGCQAVSINGRPGWKKVLRERGYVAPPLQTLGKTLDILPAEGG